MKHVSFIHSFIHPFIHSVLQSGFTELPLPVQGSLGTWVCPASHATQTLHTPERLLEDLELPVLLFHQAGHVRHPFLEHTQLVVLSLDQGHVPFQFYLLLLVKLS